MTIFDLLTITPANCALTIYNRNGEYFTTIGVKEVLENPNHNNLYLLKIDRIVPTNCKYLLQVLLK